MKSKKILSLLLTVAMIVACSVSAFAAPTGYDAYIQSGTSQILSEGQTLYTGAAMPTLDGEGAIRADVTVAPLTDAEVQEIYGATPQDMGCPADWKDATYLVTVDAKDLGTLVAKRTGAVAALYKYNGFKIGLFSMNFKFDKDDVVCVGALSSGLNEDITASVFAGNGFVSETEYKFEYSDGTAIGGYPANNTGTVENASVDGAASILFFAKPGSTITLSNGYAMYYNYNNSEAKDADGNAWSNTTVAYWHPASITLGEAEEEIVPVAATAGSSDEYTENEVAYKNWGVKVENFAKAGTGVQFNLTAKKGDATETKAPQYAWSAFTNGTAIESDTTSVSVGLNIDKVPADVTITATAQTY